MRKYLKIFDIGVQNTFVYRWNFLFRALFGVIPLLGTLFVWSAIFEARGSAIQNFDYDSVVYYFLLVLILDGLISPGDDEWQVAADIRDGQMNAFLTKPVNYLIYRLTLFISNRLLYSLVTLPISLTLLLVFHRYLFWPSSCAAWISTPRATARSTTPPCRLPPRNPLPLFVRSSTSRLSASPIPNCLMDA